MLFLRAAVWAACLPLLWPPGVCPCHGPVALLTGDAPADDDCCAECAGADQSRLVESPVALDLALPTLPADPFTPLPRLVSQRSAPPPDPSPPPHAFARLNC